MITQLFETKAANAHIRPVNLPHDLVALANLIEIAFGDELITSDSHMVQDMRQAALMGGFLWMASGARLGGFVWVEDGQIVGNITLSKDPHAWTNWLICNVAVLPEYRKRGIASSLLDTALRHIRAYHGQRVRLQVRQGHETAYEIYRRCGFTTYDTLYELSLTARQLKSRHSQSDKRLRPIRPADGQVLWKLVCESAAPALIENKLLYAGDYRCTLLNLVDNWVERFLSGRSRYEWVGYSGRQLSAYGALKADMIRGPHEFELVVAPDERGHWEEGLIGHMMKSASGGPAQNIHANASLTHPEALAAYEAAGFITQRVLSQMSLEIH